MLVILAKAFMEYAVEMALCDMINIIIHERDL
jgi:hypothetical protein